MFKFKGKAVNPEIVRRAVEAAHNNGTKIIYELERSQFAWVYPWSVEMVDGEPMLLVLYFMFPKKTQTATVPIKLERTGYVIYGKKLDIQKKKNFSHIYYRKYKVRPIWLFYIEYLSNRFIGRKKKQNVR